MAVPQLNIITKGIFAVSVVAVTAIVGSVGFAQAQKGGLGAGDGYGGNGALIRAAIAQYQTKISAAQQQYQSDVQDCLSQAGVGNPDRDDFNRSNTSAVNSLRSFAANPARVNDSETQLERSLESRSDDVTSAFATTNTNLLTKLNRNHHNYNAANLQRCLRQASSTFRASLRAAQQELMAALRDITHHRRRD